MPNMNQYLKEDFPKNLSIDIGAKHSFKNYDKITEWANKELEFYKDIGNPGNIVHTYTHTLKNNIANKFNQNRNDNFTGEELIDELKNFIQSTYKTQGFIASKSTEGIWLLKQHSKKFFDTWFIFLFSRQSKRCPK